MVHKVCMLDISLGDISLEMVLFGLVVFLVSAVIYGVATIKKKVQADDNLPEFEVTGRVIEKTTEQDGVAGIMNFSVEWVVIEDEKGNRRRFRNTRTNQIFISPGDHCKLTVRGHTIYGYTRVKD